MAQSANVATVRRVLDAFNRLDIESVLADADPEIELREWPTAPGAQAYHGREGMRRALDSWFESWDWMQVELMELREVDDHVLFALHQRARGKGSKVEVEIKSFNVYTFRNGKLVRIELFTEHEPALEAAGLNPEHEEEKR
jgi:ketosteroid isomerase-like protein